MTRDQKIQRAIDSFNAKADWDPWRGYARRPILATDCDYEIVSISGVQGRRVA